MWALGKANGREGYMLCDTVYALIQGLLCGIIAIEAYRRERGFGISASCIRQTVEARSAALNALGTISEYDICQRIAPNSPR